MDKVDALRKENEELEGIIESNLKDWRKDVDKLNNEIKSLKSDLKRVRKQRDEMHLERDELRVMKSQGRQGEEIKRLHPMTATEYKNDLNRPPEYPVKMAAVPLDICRCNVCGKPATRVTYEIRTVAGGPPLAKPYKKWFFHCDIHGKKPGNGLIPSEEVFIREVE